MPKKVFELAKEINLRPLELLEVLKEKKFNVRNHMSVLSDDMLVKVEALFKSKVSEPKPPAKKKKKKKTEGKKSPSVIRRRASSGKPSSPKPDEKEEVAATPERKEEKKEIPPYVPASERKPPAEKESESASSQKRLKGLATMITRKKSNFSRSQILNQSRADNELKSYAALSTLGRPLYSQVKKKKSFHGVGNQTQITQMKESKRVIQLHRGGTILEIAQKLRVKVQSLIDQVLDLNLLVRQDDYVGISLANDIAQFYGYRVEDISFKEDEILSQQVSQEDKEEFPLRDPVITIMGHVDHGKTTLLDAIRKTKVAQSEAGGITQHMGAYCVDVSSTRLTFLDTPGHAAFAAMRQRGADITDIVILVVAADDGVMPQTRESLQACQQAGKTLIVAVNKIDKEQANVDRIKKELSELNVLPEDWGGDIPFVPVSALARDGLDDLLETVALQAEVLELKADPKGAACGVVIESRIESGRGVMATVLIQSGTLKKGDYIVVGETYGRARNLSNFQGESITSAGPSSPVQILGLNQTPRPGDLMNAVKNEREAKKVTLNRIEERKELQASVLKDKVSLEDFFAAGQKDSSKQKTLNLIIRTDVEGLFEAIKLSLESLGNDEVSVKIIGGGAGPIGDSDINLAASADGFIIGFNMRPVTSARRLAEEKGVDIKTYSIIYQLIEDVKLAMEGLLESEFTEEYVGRAEVKETFFISKTGTVAGSEVIEGKIVEGCSVRLLRDGKIIFDGKMSSLKRFKDNVKEVKNGMECGIGLENYNDIKVGDVFEAYSMVEVKRRLDEINSLPSSVKETEQVVQ